MKIESYSRPRNWEAIITSGAIATAIVYFLIFQPVRWLLR